MTNTNQIQNVFPIPLPARGIAMDASGLFGIERGENGLFRAVGPDGRRASFWLTAQAAQTVSCQFQPDGEDIAALIADGEGGEALTEAAGWMRTWDMMAPMQALLHLAFYFEKEPREVVLPDIVDVVAEPDGTFRLAASREDGPRSSEAAWLQLAAAILHNWEGLSAAADIAAEHVDGRDEIADALIRRWDVEVASARRVTGRAA